MGETNCFTRIPQPCELSDSFQNAKSKFLWLFGCAAAQLTSYVWNLATQWGLTPLRERERDREREREGENSPKQTWITCGDWSNVAYMALGLWTLTDGVGRLFAPLSSAAWWVEGVWSCGTESRNAPFLTENSSSCFWEISPKINPDMRQSMSVLMIKIRSQFRVTICEYQATLWPCRAQK